MDIESGNNDKLQLVMPFLSRNVSQKTWQTKKGIGFEGDGT